MISFITMLAVGAVLILLGVRNMRGDISTLHSYHRSHVKDEDVLPFGRLCGIGTITVGIGIIIFGALTYATELSGIGAFVIIGTVVMIVSLVVGLAICIYAMKKYNGGVFR